MSLTVLPLRFLVVDHHPDSRFLLVKTLQRKFPNARIEEAEDGEDAIARVGSTRFDTIVTHRTREFLGIELVGKLREKDNQVPIVMVSGIERTEPALAAGADGFLLYDEWLLIGTMVQQLLAVGRKPHFVSLEIMPRDGKSGAAAKKRT